MQFRLPDRIPPADPKPSARPPPLPFPGVRAGVGDAGAARGGFDGAGGGAGGQHIVGRRCGVSGADVVGVRVPWGVVQPVCDAAVAGLRGIPGVAGAAELPQAQLRPLSRRRRRVLRAPLGCRRSQPPLVPPAGMAMYA